MLLLSPLAQLVAQTLLAMGLSLRASASAESWTAAVAIILGLMLFSLGRAGIAVAQHAMLASSFWNEVATVASTLATGTIMTLVVPAANLTAQDKQLSQKEMDAMFDRLDQNHDGLISLAEVRDGLVKLSAEPPEGAKSGWYVGVVGGGSRRRLLGFIL